LFTTKLVETIDEKPIWAKLKSSIFAHFSRIFRNFGQNRSASGRKPGTADPSRHADIEITNLGDRMVANVLTGVRYTCLVLTNLVESMDEKPIWDKLKISIFSDFSKNFKNLTRGADGGQSRGEDEKLGFEASRRRKKIPNRAKPACGIRKNVSMKKRFGQS
jgi:hypothetical protein